jgi:Tfp pilus assembly major pilin PilA
VATLYRLWVKNSSGTWFIQNLYQASDICSTTNCTVTPANALSNDSYTWYVQTLTATQNGTWSSQSFTVNAPNVMGAVTLISPLTTITTRVPTYTWSKDPVATLYRIWVKNSSGTWVIQNLYQASNICGTTNCTVTPGNSLANDSYIWYVQTLTATQNGTWSSQTFTVNAPNVMGAVTLISPLATTATHTPTYIWSKDPVATLYRLWVKNSSGTWVIQQLILGANICGATNCAVTPNTSLTNDTYTWYVQTLTATQNGQWSGQLTTVSAPDENASSSGGEEGTKN